MNTDTIAFIPKFKGIQNSPINGYTRNPGGVPISVDPFNPQLIPFSYYVKVDPNEAVFNGATTHITDNPDTSGYPNPRPSGNFQTTSPFIELYRHSNNFNTAHSNFKINATVRNKEIKQLSIEIIGGICINSSDGNNVNDEFELDYVYTQLQSTMGPTDTVNNTIGQLTNNSGIITPFIYPTVTNLSLGIPNPPNSVYNSYDEAFDGGSNPKARLSILHSYDTTAPQSIQSTIFVLVNGIITIF